MKQKHYDLIMQWAEGATIQYLNDITNKWVDCSDNLPAWDHETEYRVKPKPAPDYVLYGQAVKSGVQTLCLEPRCWHNLKLIWDGDTGKLKDAEVIIK